MSLTITCNFGSAVFDMPLQRRSTGCSGLGDIDYAFNGVVGSAGVEFILPQNSRCTSFMQGFGPRTYKRRQYLVTLAPRSVPNPDLGPERTDTIEAGIKLQLGPVQMNAAYFCILSDAIGADLTAWRRDERSLITNRSPPRE